MFLSPLQETPHLGRNVVYWLAIFLFTLFQAPILKPTNLTCILIFRFLTGFVGSPILATGGASMADLFTPRNVPYAMGVWSVGAVCGPILGSSSCPSSSSPSSTLSPFQHPSVPHPLPSLTLVRPVRA